MKSQTESMNGNRVCVICKKSLGFDDEDEKRNCTYDHPDSHHHCWEMAT